VDRINIGIVGCGHITAAHLNGFKELSGHGLLEDVTIKALCDRERWKADSFVQKGVGPEQQKGVGPEGDPMQAPPVWVSEFQEASPEVYSDAAEMYAKAGIDTVWLCTSVHTHHSLGLAAIEAGMHLLIEKPIALTVKAGLKLVEAARRKGVTVGVAECVRYLPEARIAHWAFDQGYLGRPQFSLYAAMGGYWAPDKIVAGTSWRHSKMMAAGGVSVDWMVHFFHYLRYVMGEVEAVNGIPLVTEPTRVIRNANGTILNQVRNEVDDTLTCSIQYENGAAGSVLVSWAGHGTEVNVPPIFYGSKGSIDGDQIVIDGRVPQPMWEFFQENAEPNTKEQFFPRGITNGFTLEILDFLNALKTGGQMETSGEQGVRDLSCCFSVLEAALQGRTMPVHEVYSQKAASYEKNINENWNI